MQAVFESAVVAGQLDVCAWLQRRGWPLDTRLLAAAARSGKQVVYEWLLANGCRKGNEVVAAAQAASQGHVGMMDWLLLGASPPDATPRVDSATLLRAAAAGCDLLTLVRLHHAYLGSLSRELPNASQQAVVADAAGSPTADWRAKLEWLEARGYPHTTEASMQAADKPDALHRLQWLQQRGYPLHRFVAHTAARAGNVEALRNLLDQGAINHDEVLLIRDAAQGGHVATMEMLHARGMFADSEATERAACSGHLPAVTWLVERLGTDTALTAGVFAKAAVAGSMALMVWLREAGCPWDENTFYVAAAVGSEEQLEWLAEQGCPMGDDGEPYVYAVGAGNLANLSCLRRLGYPWRPGGGTFTLVVESLPRDLEDHVVRALCWLLDQGCPVDWDEAEATAEERGSYELLEWLQMQGQQRA